jgi:hypothetical protein
VTKPYSLIGILLLSATAVTQTTTSTTVSGAQPASSTTSSGANAPATLVVQGVKGGNDSANSGIAGQGSNPSITQNASSTITQTSTAGTTGSICDAGTLTLANTSTLFTTANPAVFKVAPSWTVIAPTAVIITVEVHNLSQQDITLL